ncbi:MAG TPA: peptide chain release factor 2 [Acidimicrobiales bacterium]|nr:peptide chain release factor 2 [Acidimicrobiales bacterium]
MAPATAPGGAGPGEGRALALEQLGELRRRLDAANTYLRLEELRKQLAELEAEVGEPGLWSDAERARKVTTAYGRVKSDVDHLEGLASQLEEAGGLLELADEEGEEALAAVLPEIEAAIATVGGALDELELRSLFSGEHDERDAIVEIHAGAGGTDAQDWADMMLRMYLRWAERRGMAVELDEASPGQEAGILSATFVVHGRHAYGLLTAERGVHRLVRMSPFDSQHRRQTSFASFEVTPFLDDATDEVEIDEKDLRIDTYRSSGAGGQHVNVTDSAVRITHLPTGIVVSCQNERSQHQNKAKAMQILAAKLADRQREERRHELSALTGPQTEVAWGNQIRSYVLAPYQQVKDLRTAVETGNVEAVLDGDLDEFMVGFLRWRRAREGGGGS